MPLVLNTKLPFSSILLNSLHTRVHKHVLSHPKRSIHCHEVCLSCLWTKTIESRCVITVMDDCMKRQLLNAIRCWKCEVIEEREIEIRYWELTIMHTTYKKQTAKPKTVDPADGISQVLKPGFASNDTEEGAKWTRERAELNRILFSKYCHTNNRICTSPTHFTLNIQFQMLQVHQNIDLSV